MSELRVVLQTQVAAYVLPATPLTVPASVRRAQLSRMINSMLDNGVKSRVQECAVYAE